MDFGLKETAKVLYTAEHLPFVFDVLVDESCDGERSKGEVPASNDGQNEVEDDAENSQRPVIVAEPWSPVGRLQDRLKHADEVHEQVAYEEEPTENAHKAHGLSHNYIRLYAVL